MWEVDMNSPTAPLSSAPSTSTNVLIKIVIVDSKSDITGDLVPLLAEDTTWPVISRHAFEDWYLPAYKEPRAWPRTSKARSPKRQARTSFQQMARLPCYRGKRCR